MALPTTITSGNSGLWPANVSGNLGPFIYNDNVYVVLYDDPDNDGTSVDIQVWKATDPTSSFTVQDAAGEPSFNDGTASFLRAMDVYEQDGILYVCFVLERTGAVLYDIRTAMFSMVDDIWMDAPDGVGGPSDLTYSPTDDPTTYWGGITVRDDGDIIIVHPGENPSTMGGTYQEVAYSRYGNTSRVTDGTTGLAFSASGNTIIRDTGNWASDGFSAATADGTNTIRVFGSENSGENDGVYTVASITTTTNTADTLNLNQAVITNAADTTATVYSLNDLNYSLTSGTVVASTAAKDDNYLYAYVVMGSSDQCHFGYVRDTDSDFYLRALSSGNALRTQRTSAGTYGNVCGGINYTRSSTEKIAFNVFSTNGVQRFKLYFTHFTDDSSPTFTVETATNNGTSGSQYRSGYSLVADTEASGVDNYLPYPNGSNSGQVFLQGDDGGTTWSDQNSSSSIQTTAENATGISANIFTRDGNRVLAFITNASGTTVKYDEFTLYSVGGGKVFPRRAVRFVRARF